MPPKKVLKLDITPVAKENFHFFFSVKAKSAGTTIHCETGKQTKVHLVKYVFKDCISYLSVSFLPSYPIIPMAHTFLEIGTCGLFCLSNL